MKRPANPDTYYPLSAQSRGEEGAPVVQVCVDQRGKLLREPVVTDSSGFPDLDKAAIDAAKASGYAPGLEGGKPVVESCMKYRILFRRHPH
jgi:TonB family protein